MAKVEGRTPLARADKSVGAGRQECLRHVGREATGQDNREKCCTGKASGRPDGKFPKYLFPK
jgi:hypothetical protein